MSCDSRCPSALSPEERTSHLGHGTSFPPSPLSHPPSRLAVVWGPLKMFPFMVRFGLLAWTQMGKLKWTDSIAELQGESQGAGGGRGSTGSGDRPGLAWGWPGERPTPTCGRHMADSVTQSTPAGSAELPWGLEQWVYHLGGSGLISCPVVRGDHWSHRSGTTMSTWGRGRGWTVGGSQAAHCLSPKHTLEWGWGLMMVPDIWRLGERTAYPGNQPPSPGAFFMPRNLLPPLLCKDPRPSVPPSPGLHHSSPRLWGHVGVGWPGGDPNHRHVFAKLKCSQASK